MVEVNFTKRIARSYSNNNEIDSFISYSVANPWFCGLE